MIEPIPSYQPTARGQFYKALAGVQAELTPTSTLADALALLPQHGLAWHLIDGYLQLGHSDGHVVTAPNSGETYADDLSWLLGLPSFVVVATDAPAMAPAAPEPAPADPAPAPTPAPAPVVQPEPAPADPEPAGEDPALSTKPLSPDDANYARTMVGELNTAQKTTFKKAFCETFAISPAPLRVAGLITEERHAAFVHRFVDEAKGIARP